MNLNVFYLCFNPEIYRANWHVYMLHSTIASLIIVIFSIALYGFLPYQREKESVKFWAIFASAMFIATIYIFGQSSIIPNEICRGNYKIQYISHFLISTLILEVGLFYVASTKFLGSKKYFARVHEYLVKGNKEL